LYPRDLYVSTIAGATDPGLYHFNPYEHQLEYVNSTTPDHLAAATAQPDDLRSAATVILLSASFWRNRMKYDQRGVRFALMELGHVAQNALLAGNAMGLSALSLGGFFDDEINAMVGLDGVHESVAYMIILGSAEAIESSHQEHEE
ncbi:MAG: SagB family peptide dehydrogenase, partial [Propioniciclava sp.]